MANEIKVNIDEMQKELARFESNIAIFEPYTQNFTQHQKDRLTGFNSDFIVRLEQILNNLADDSGPELLAEIKEYHKKISSAVSTFTEVDIALADGMDE